MPTRLLGPFVLREDLIGLAVRKASPGVFVLGRTKGNEFKSSYLGRSDVDVAGELKSFVGKYPEFKVAFFPSVREAFRKECRLYTNSSAGIER